MMRDQDRPYRNSASRPLGRPSSTDIYDSEPTCHIDTPQFKEYCRKVEAVIFAAAEGQNGDFRGIGTRQIHEALDAESRYEWTADALTWLKTIEPIGLLPTRYRPRNGGKK